MNLNDDLGKGKPWVPLRENLQRPIFVCRFVERYLLSNLINGVVCDISLHFPPHTKEPNLS